MREVTEKFNVYKFNEADRELKDKIIEYLSSDSMLYDYIFQERQATLEEIAKLLDATLDFSYSVVPDRGEFIKFTPKYEELNFKAFWEVIDQEKECPLTGCFYDHDFIDHLSGYNLTESALKKAGQEFIKSIHEEWESMLTDDYINDLCEANDYEFTNNGKIYS
jgi:hypothetical protein